MKLYLQVPDLADAFECPECEDPNITITAIPRHGVGADCGPSWKVECDNGHPLPFTTDDPDEAVVIELVSA